MGWLNLPLQIALGVALAGLFERAIMRLFGS